MILSRPTSRKPPTVFSPPSSAPFWRCSALPSGSARSRPWCRQAPWSNTRRSGNSRNSVPTSSPSASPTPRPRSVRFRGSEFIRLADAMDLPARLASVADVAPYTIQYSNVAHAGKALATACGNRGDRVVRATVRFADRSGPFRVGSGPSSHVLRDRRRPCRRHAGGCGGIRLWGRSIHFHGRLCTVVGGAAFLAALAFWPVSWSTRSIVMPISTRRNASSRLRGTRRSRRPESRRASTTPPPVLRNEALLPRQRGPTWRWKAHATSSSRWSARCSCSRCS